MDKKQNLIPLQELNLTSRFLFDEVLEDPQIHQDVLGIIFQRDIPLLEKNETEKELRVSPLLRSIRMDVFSMDEEKAVYNTEMQQKRRADLAKRSRYYQSLVDAGLLEPGVPDYNRLNTSYIIMIMPFDLFGYKKYVYTFRARCEEEPECLLEDGATRIFLNTRGENDDEVPRELAEFLHYLEETTDERAASTNSQRIKRIHRRVRKVRLSEEVGVKYMQAWEEKYYEREEGAHNKLRELAAKKYRKGMSVKEIAELLEESETTVQELLKESEMR
ncbi:MAG: Rpn family recombination-promoting nuclease/putative transposase [[Clostridium] scindens]|uniref:Rpn family recombination-promoting nuclease/putative transposase n=1 Tax=Clostridium scindens (strain JCM 10418 / VPI 12708) TaxID=29347 RepID=UPI0039938A2F